MCLARSKAGRKHTGWDSEGRGGGGAGLEDRSWGQAQQANLRTLVFTLNNVGGHGLRELTAEEFQDLTCLMDHSGYYVMNSLQEEKEERGDL